jgi:SAM-dependent methyltransferase
VDVVVSTDLEWEKWGATDPYFGVLTDPSFRSDRLDDDARRRFFSSGVQHVEMVHGRCRSLFGSDFSPKRILDFGCGVGRTIIPFAAFADEVVGVDVSSSMLAEARRNCDLEGLANVHLLLTDDSLSCVQGQFDFVHSFIVLQHVEIPRGRKLLRGLADRVRPSGAAAIHVTFAWDKHREALGQPPPPVARAPEPPLSHYRRLRRFVRSLILPPLPQPIVHEMHSGPEMQMNYYSLSELGFILYEAGVETVHCDFTNHGGAIGAILYFRR